MWITKRTFLTLLLGVLLAAAAGAQGKPNIGRLEIVVKDIATQQEIAYVEPGDTVTLPSGSHVRLIMSALPTGSARGPLYPDTVFTDTSGGGVTITRSHAENSTADLVINRPKSTGRTETIRYQITDTWVPPNLRTGSFTIRIAPADYQTGNEAGSPAGSPLYLGSRAGQITRVLYEAILMREPDAGAQGTIDSIARGGYDALVQAAVGIANSEESRIRIYEQGTTNEQRLASLYRNLLGMEPSEVDRTHWRRDLFRLDERNVADVVADMVQSDRFRERHNLRGY